MSCDFNAKNVLNCFVEFSETHKLFASINFLQYLRIDVFVFEIFPISITHFIVCNFKLRIKQVNRNPLPADNNDFF